jgi:hypothetical protein
MSAERYWPMADDAFDESRLDPGIRDVVRTLRAAGFQTSDSGDGVSKPADWYKSGEALPYPHVFSVTTTRAMVDDAGILLQLLRAEHGTMGDWRVVASWSPNDGHAILEAYITNFVPVGWEDEQVFAAACARVGRAFQSETPAFPPNRILQEGDPPPVEGAPV